MIAYIFFDTFTLGFVHDCMLYRLGFSTPKLEEVVVENISRVWD